MAQCGLQTTRIDPLRINEAAMKLNNRHFVSGFVIGITVFVIANIISAHVRSSVGIGAILGIIGADDDIRAVGFPLLFWKTGGFANHTYFSLQSLIINLMVAEVVSALLGLIFYITFRSKSDE